MYPDGDFSFIDNNLYRDNLTGTYQAITIVGAWDFLRAFTPDDQRGFMFSNHEMLDAIASETDRLGVGHSGASFGIAMRHMEMIAKEGWQKYVQETVRSAGHQG